MFQLIYTAGLRCPLVSSLVWGLWPLWRREEGTKTKLRWWPSMFSLIFNQSAPLSLVESFRVVLRQLSYAIKNQLVTSKALERSFGTQNTPRWVFCLLLAGSLWHKDRWLPCTERSYYRRNTTLLTGQSANLSQVTESPPFSKKAPRFSLEVWTLIPPPPLVQTFAETN